ncbi:achacin-like [Mercenaria mercenaria]|uniref:achacin-like n=1 Tax=Mercenaria mercenaria TaxID=6596 RepID=UPI00234E99CE|nr:achacin-like [Mercenaria mercenaria]
MCSLLTRIYFQIKMSRKTVFAFVILGLMLLAAVIAIVVLAVQVNESSAKTDDAGEDDIDTSSCDDIAIIGAGISGSYAAWRLRDKGLKISVYEYSDRIGGRCFTVQLPDIPDVNIEMGAMRFVPSWHQLLNKTIHELGLETEDLTKAPTGNGDTLYYLRGKHLSYSELPFKAPYNIPENYRIDYDTLNWQIYMNFTTESSRSETLPSENKQYIKSLDGVDLYMQSWDFFSGKFLDKETTAYIEDAAGYDDGFAGTSAAKYVPKAKQSEWSTARFKTVTKGFQALPTTMLEQFLNESAKDRFYPNHHLRSIKRNQNGMYLITFQPTETISGITSDVQVSIKPNLKHIVC